MSKNGETNILEKTPSGLVQLTRVRNNSKVATLSDERNRVHGRRTRQLIDFLRTTFLPSGYPVTVTDDYLRYQILNSLQAFCSSLASLISSRAVLQGFGVGDANASPTEALLLTIAQDVFSRLTTIAAASVIGTALYPEARFYRFLADILNDVALLLDTLSPLLNTFNVRGLRIITLCCSAAFRSLCGITAGGAKAAITLHFASPVTGKGDVGDLNAKDASKETILALFGMLLGTWIVPRITSGWAIWTVLLTLIGLHLTINYVGVSGLVLRTLNRQRATIAWMSYRTSPRKQVLTPLELLQLERLFDTSGVIRDIGTSKSLGRCTIGSSLSQILHHPLPDSLTKLFENERYVIWFDRRNLYQTEGNVCLTRGHPQLQICLKEGYTSLDQLKAWFHAVEFLCQAESIAITGVNSGHIDAIGALDKSYRTTISFFDDFMKKMERSGWVTEDCALLTQAPAALLISASAEDKKLQ